MCGALPEYATASWTNHCVRDETAGYINGGSM